MYVNFITNQVLLSIGDHYDAFLPYSGGRDVGVWQGRNVGQARNDVYIFYQRLIQPSRRLHLPQDPKVGATK